MGKPDKKTESTLALQQIRRIRWRYHLKPTSVGGDKAYGNGSFLHGLITDGITPHVPMIDYRSRNDKGIHPITAFSFDKEKNVFLCPEGKELTYRGFHRQSNQQVYRARSKDCGICPGKPACTRDRARSVSYHLYDDALKRARHLNTTKPYRISQRMRKRIEELFGEAKEFMGLRRAKFRGVRFVREQVLMTATAQNIKRMVKLLAGRPRRAMVLATGFSIVSTVIAARYILQRAIDRVKELRAAPCFGYVGV